MSIKNDEIPKHRSSKDRRKWCGGKVGREHDPMWSEGTKVKNTETTIWYEYQCQKCHKNLDTYWYFNVDWAYVLRVEEFERPVLGSREPLKKKVQDGGTKMDS